MSYTISDYLDDFYEGQYPDGFFDLTDNPPSESILSPKIYEIARKQCRRAKIRFMPSCFPIFDEDIDRYGIEHVVSTIVTDCEGWETLYTNEIPSGSNLF